MLRTYLIPLLAICGVIFAVATVVKGSRPPVAQPPVIEPPRAPFEAFVAGSGLIEASTRNIEVGTPVGDIVTAVHAEVGKAVRAGEPLFEVDSRDLRAELDVRRAQASVARERLAKLKMGTRPEQIPPARAKLAEAESLLQDAEDQLSTWEQVTDRRAVREEEINRRRFAVAVSRSRVEQAKSDLALLEAGTWAPDITVAEQEVALADSQVRQIETEIERRTVRAPVDGTLLQVNIRIGEFAQSGRLSTPLMLLGGTSTLHVRVDVDEHESWRVRPDRPARFYVRGNKDINGPLTFVRFEPYVIPKRSLTGESTERVDTRVLQIVYAFDPSKLPVFVGQQVDVYIEADPIHTAAPVAAPTGDTL